MNEGRMIGPRTRRFQTRKTQKRVRAFFLSLTALILLLLYTYLPGIGRQISATTFSWPAKFETEFYKNILESSINIITLTYDSGTSTVNFKSEMDILLHALTGVDLGDPSSMLKASVPGYSSFMKGYEPPKENKENKPKPNGSISPKPTKSSSITDNQGNLPDDESEPPNVNNNTSIAVSNIANIDVDVDKLLAASLPYELFKSKPQILIYHTHASEGYSDGKKYGVMKAGGWLNDYLEKRYGMNVIHNGTVNDKDYNTSYTTAFYTASEVLRGNKSIDVVIDLHRDGLAPGKDALKVTSTYKGKKYAQIMMVVGTNKTLTHPNWQKNMTLAVKLQKKLNEICPGITRPIYLSAKRYNQHLSDGAIIVEMGANGNSLEEVKNSTEMLSRAIYEVLKPSIK